MKPILIFVTCVNLKYGKLRKGNCNKMGNAGERTGWLVVELAHENTGKCGRKKIKDKIEVSK
jgi:hypothetical protein